MSFIVSNIPFSNIKKQDDLYIKGNYINKDGHLLLFKGVIYPGNKKFKENLLNQIIEEGIKSVSKLKGYFCGIYHNIEKKKVYFFTDKYGYYDLFYFFNENSIIISDNFNEILNAKKFTLNDVDRDSLIEFVLFQFPLLEKTFIKKIRLMPLGSIYEIDLNQNILEKCQYSDYIFNIHPELNLEECIDKLENIFNNAIKKIKNLNPPETIYGLGLSGGLDSRLVAYYMVKNKLRIKTFIFGEKNSDAYYISRKIAKLLKLDHYEVGLRKDFFKYSEKSIKYNPMMDVLFTWYYSVYKNLPYFDILMTGFNGDNQFGSHLKKKDLYIKNELEFVAAIFDKYYEFRSIKNFLTYFNNKSIISKIKQEIIEFSQRSLNSEFWQKIEEFNFKYRQRVFIKNNPSFNFLGLFKSYTIFMDPDFMEFIMTIPFHFRLNRQLFLKFLKRKLLFLLKIRPERGIPIYYNIRLLKVLFKLIRVLDKKIFKTRLFFKKNHKNLEEWLSNNKIFENYIKKSFSEKNQLFNELFNNNKIDKLISKGRWDDSEIALIFRFLTVKLFLDMIKKSF